MKVRLIIVLLMFISLAQVFGQERVNRSKISFDNKSEVLEKATGWKYNSTLGEWIDYPNIMSDNKTYKQYPSLWGAELMSKTSSFLTIQIKSTIINNIKYYILITEGWEGAYEYPEIKENWEMSKTIHGYIFTESEYNKLKNFDKLVELQTYCIVSTSSYVYDEVIFLDLIQTELQKRHSQFIAFTFPVMKSTDGKVRFCLPSYDTYDFRVGYFETSFEFFSKLLTIK
jgi:hypothetical protein